MANAKNEAKVIFRAETSEFDNDIKNANRTLGELRSELKLNQTQMKGVEDQTELLSEQHNILERQLQESQKKTEAVNEKLQVAMRVYGENSDEVSRLRVQLNNAREAEERVRQAVSDCEKAMEQQADAADELADTISEAGEEAEKSGDGYSMLKDVLSDLAADAIQGAIDAFSELAVEGEQSLDKLQAATGLSSKTMEQYKDVMYDVYGGNYGESLSDVSESMTTIVQIMGEMDGAELQSMTESALTLRDAYDVDVQESILAADQMMKQFGISSEEAFNLIIQGNQKGLNANGDFLDILNEFSVHYAGLGLSAEDMLNTLKGGASEGVFSLNIVGDAFKEFGIKIKDGSDNTALALEMLGYGASASEEEIEKTKDTIEKLEKNLKYAKMEQANFNEKTSELTRLKNKDKIEEYSKSLEDAKQKLQMLRSETGGTRGSIDELTEAFAKGGEDASNAYWEIWRALGEVDDELERNTIGVNLFGTMWEDLGDKAITSAMTMTDEFNGTIDSMKELDTIMYDNVGSQIAQLGRTLKNDLTEPVISTLEPVVKDVIGFANDNLPLVEAGIVGVGVALGALLIITSITKGVSLATKAWTLFNGVLAANPIGLVITLVTGLIAGFATLYNKSEAFRNMVDGVVTDISGAIGWIGDKISNFKIPKIKMPNITVTYKTEGVLAKAAQFLGLEGLPKFGIEWHKYGGLMTKPTIFGMNRDKFLGGGEAGPEAILPLNTSTLGSIGEGVISALEQRVSNDSIANEIQRLRSDLNTLIDVTKSGKNLYIDGNLVSKNTGKYDDINSAKRAAFAERGLA